MPEAATEANILSRLDRLDNLMAYLEEEARDNNDNQSFSPATASSLTSDGGCNSSANSSPKGTGLKRRSMDDVVLVTQLKGSLIDRIDNLESRLFKLQEEIQNQKKREAPEENKVNSTEEKMKKAPKKGVKKMLKSCVRLDTKE